MPTKTSSGIRKFNAIKKIDHNVEYDFDGLQLAQLKELASKYKSDYEELRNQYVSFPHLQDDPTIKERIGRAKASYERSQNAVKQLAGTDKKIDREVAALDKAQREQYKAELKRKQSKPVKVNPKNIVSDEEFAAVLEGTFIEGVPLLENIKEQMRYSGKKAMHYLQEIVKARGKTDRDKLEKAVNDFKYYQEFTNRLYEMYGKEHASQQKTHKEHTLKEVCNCGNLTEAARTMALARWYGSNAPPRMNKRYVPKSNTKMPRHVRRAIGGR